jgi:hypothetical protein
VRCVGIAPVLASLAHRRGAAPVLLLGDVAAKVLRSDCIHDSRVHSPPDGGIPLTGVLTLPARPGLFARASSRLAKKGLSERDFTF